MDTPRTEAEERWTSGRGLLTLWTAVLAGPIVWAIRFTAVYVMAGAACTGWGVVAMATTSVVAIGVCLSAAWVGWTTWSELGGGPTTAGGVIGRARFMAMGGVVLSLLFTFVVLVESIPLFMIEPCRQ